MSVRGKLSIALVIFVLFLGTVLYYALYQEYQLFNDVKSQQTKHHVTTVRSYVKKYIVDVKDTAELLAYSEILKRGLLDEERKQTIDYITPIFKNTHMDMINIYDKKGILFAGAEDPSVHSIHDGLYFFSQRVLKQNSAQTLVKSVDGRIFLLAAQPLRKKSKVLGVVIVGLQLDRAFAQRLARSIDAEIEVYFNKNMVAASNPDLINHEIDNFKVTSVNFSRNYSLANPEKFDVKILEDNSFAYSQFYTKVKSILISSIFLSMIAFLIVLEIVTSLTSRLRRLSDWTKRLATGELDIDFKPEKGTDEIAKLNKDFQLMHQALKKRSEDLDQRNHDLEKSNIDLKRAKYLADKASRSKSQFLANMSHEIRTPMNGIMGMADLLSHSALDKKQKNQLQIIINSSKSLLTIINDILDFSKIEAGKLEIEKIPFNLHKTVEEVISLFIHTAEEKNVSLNLVVCSSVNPHVVGDPARLRQILNNLLGNALKFTSDGSVSLFVTANPSGSKVQEVRFEVIDTGAGISRKNLKKIFAAFSQEDGTVTRKFGGTGLGLAISKQLSHLMGGALNVDSQLNKGAKFTVVLPLPESVLHEELNPIDNSHAILCTSSQIQVDSITNLLSYYKIQHSVLNSTDGLSEEIQQHVKVEKQVYVIVDSDLMLSENENIFWNIYRNNAFREVSLILVRPLNNRKLDQLQYPPSLIAQLTKPVRPTEFSDLFTNSAKSLADDANDIVFHELELPKFKCDILLVQSEIVNQKITLGMLRLLGCDCELATTEKEAIAKLQKRKYNAVMIDTFAIKSNTFLAEVRQTLNERAQANVPLFLITEGVGAKLTDEQMRFMEGKLSRPLHFNKIINLLGKWKLSVNSVNYMDHPNYAINELSKTSTQRMAAEDAVLDIQTLESMRALQIPGRPNIIYELCSLYMDDSALIIENLEKAIEGGDAVAAKHFSHALKSSSSNVGAKRLADHCYQLEINKAETVDKEILDISKKIVEEHRIACAELERVCQGESQ